MSTALLSRYVEERQALADHVANILGAAESQERDCTDADNTALKEAEQRMVEIDTQVASLKSVLERQNSALDVQHLLARGAARETARTQVTERAPASLGSFVDSEQYRAWNGRGKSESFELDIQGTQLRAPLMESTAPGSALLPQIQRVVLPQAEALYPLLDVVGRLPISSNSVDLVTYGSPKGATGAAVVPEGAAKPEATLVATSGVQNVETIAHWVQASRQLLQDAPAAKALIDSQLRRGLMTKLESEISTAISGATYTKTVGAAKADALTVSRNAIADLQSSGWKPNAILTDPLTAAGFDLFFLGKAPIAGAMLGAPVWGMQVIPVAGLTKTYVGDFNIGVTLLERTGVEVFISDSHQDTFIKNLFTILAEMRAKAVVTNPAAIREITLTP